MKFHEDIIFKNHGRRGGQSMLKIMNLKGKIVEIHETEYSILDPKMYKPDFIVEVQEKICIIEFQSTYVDINDKKRFRFYTAIIDHIKNKSNKEIEVHVLSTVEKEMTKIYSISSEAVFPIYIHSLKSMDGNKTLNMIKNKITKHMELNDYELMLLTLVPFMNTSEDIEHAILNTTNVIISIENIDKDISQFIKGVELLVADKFIKTEYIKTSVSNLLGGNMKIVEDYANNKVEKVKTETVIHMFENGVSVRDIVKWTPYGFDFIKSVLSKEGLI